jgi:hypothetical protein
MVFTWPPDSFRADSSAMADEVGAGARVGEDGLIELKVIVLVRVAGSICIARGGCLL